MNRFIILLALLSIILAPSCSTAVPVQVPTPKSHKLNHLQSQTSPYLLQHADNPVDWYPWSNEAIERARNERKPILLSIGYSACHWCHVMEQESFEDPETAGIMNEHFINVKVDREERPDLDEIYMRAVTAMTGRGGWPVTVFLTPDLKPFFAGTYFPKNAKPGMPSFKALLLHIARQWQRNRTDLVLLSNSITNGISDSESDRRLRMPARSKTIDDSIRLLLKASDREWGGLGTAPKFPYPGVIDCFLRYSLVADRLGETRKAAVRAFLDTTLDRMSMGGLYDQIGGGFARYSTDRQWLIPHFEKMLYDNALLSGLYLDGYRLTKDTHWRAIAEDTLDFVTRELTDQKGYFYSSLDADSEHEEGKYYLMRQSDLKNALGDKDAEFAAMVFGVTESGNFGNGASVPRLTGTTAELAKKSGLSQERFLKRLDNVRARLFEYRAARTPPDLDSKMIVAWNALMISSLTRGYMVLRQPKYLRSARRAAGFILTNLRPSGKLARTYSRGRAHIPAYLDDYAFTVQALLDLSAVDPDPAWFSSAKDLSDMMIEKFFDSRSGTFFLSSNKDHTDLILQARSDRDGAVPSGTSIAAMNLLRLARLSGDAGYKEIAHKVLRAYAGKMLARPDEHGYLLSALIFDMSQESEIVMMVDRTSDEESWRPMQYLIGERYLPDTVMLTAYQPTGHESRRSFSPLLEGKSLVDDKTTVFICRKFACAEPVSDITRLEGALNRTFETFNRPRK